MENHQEITKTKHFSCWNSSRARFKLLFKRLEIRFIFKGTRSVLYNSYSHAYQFSGFEVTDIIYTFI